MYFIYHTKQFKKSLNKILTSGKVKIKDIEIVVDMSSSGKKLPIKYSDHDLKGEYFGYRECHIKADLLLVYKIEKDQLVLVLVDISSHSDLF
ncbi:MAG: type II toxin-antitoxin system YafQ family toxin [Candidatus Moranbacteria bacterium]|nr:type II toxin-antitoxin system YafQ family toxin [Candidatus Moranbacteria bacterium]